MNIGNILLIALFIEAIVDVLKPVWQKDAGKINITQWVSIGIGILLAVACRINMVAGFVPADWPGWVNYLWYVLTGVAIGRGPSFLYDLWQRIRNFDPANLKNE